MKPPTKPCPHCHGRGTRQITISTMTGPDINEVAMCSYCDGTGMSPIELFKKRTGFYPIVPIFYKRKAQ